ncbi:MAG: hypothetical protein R2813_00505 [Flavobacteriales bacterium]
MRLLLITGIVCCFLLSSCKALKGKDCDCPHWSKVEAESTQTIAC